MTAAFDELLEAMEGIDEDAIDDELSRQDLLTFTKVTFIEGDEYLVNFHHEHVAEMLERWAFGDIDRLILCLPPQHGKSQLACRSLPAWILGRDPNAKIILTAYVSDLAVLFSRAAKRIINSDRYKQIFPNTKINQKRVTTMENEDSINRADEWEIVGYRGSVMARGVGGPTSGRGAKYLIIDDPIKDSEEARSVIIREKVWRWFNRVLKTRGSKDCRILVIMTRWDGDDLVGRLIEEMKKENADQWFIVEFAAIAGDGIEMMTNDPRQEGEALWPEFKDEKFWAGFKATDPEGYYSLGQQRPVPSGGRIIKANWVAHHWLSIPDARNARWIVVCDPKAGSKNKRSSKCVFQLWMQPFRERGRAYFIDQTRGIWDNEETLAVALLHADQDYSHLDLPDEFLRVMEAMKRRPLFNIWKWAREWKIEDKADGKQVVRSLKSRIPGMETWKNGGRGKEDRLRGCVPWLSAGCMITPENAEWREEFEQEVLNFPAALSDDQTDCMTMALDVFFGQAVDIWADLKRD